MGLKELPGWRLAARAKLNSPCGPARALMAPVWGSTVTTSGGRVVRIRQYVLGGLDSRVLEVGVERRVDPESPALQGLRFSSSSTLRLTFSRKGVYAGPWRRVGCEVQGRSFGLLSLLGGDHALVLHQLQYPVAALAGLRHENVALPGHGG